MTQNISTAVMQRRIEPHDSLDDFPTPPWATRALCEWMMGNECDRHFGMSRFCEIPLSLETCREPTANRGHMVRPLQEYFKSVEASDICDYGENYDVRDYLFGPAPEIVDWTVTNPPFRLASQFINRALRTSRTGVAVIVRTAFLEGQGRYNDLFAKQPPAAVLQFTERVVMHKGKLAPKGSTATAYCWVVWRTNQKELDTKFEWIAPCRKRLERAGDYPT